jgi:cytochrome bd-type quinol oxidase subunit 2
LSPRVVLHSAILALANLCSIWFGFLAFALSSVQNQLGVQLPVAFLVSVLMFGAWVKVVESRGPAGSRIRSRRDWIWIYVLAPVCAALVFVPLHYVVEGYLTAFSNLTALWAFQLVVNVAVVAISKQLRESRRDNGARESRTGDAERTAV